MKLSSILVASTALLCAAEPYAAETKITFEGRYEYRTDTESVEILGEQVCFFPSKPSSENVPRPPGDYRIPWFCFTNSKKVAHLFGFKLNASSHECGFKGNAKITVSSYKRYTGEGNDNDVATLNAVLGKSKPESLPCSE